MIAEALMGQILIRNIPDETIETYKAKARLNGRSLEQEVRLLLETHRRLSPQEKISALKEIRARVKPGEPMTLDQIREGLE
jgi:plasmid stability protein